MGLAAPSPLWLTPHSLLYPGAYIQVLKPKSTKQCSKRNFWVKIFKIRLNPVLKRKKFAENFENKF